jgi:hypothetical protein
MPIRYYINSDLKPSEWEEPLLPGQVPVTWRAEVVAMGTLVLRASPSVMWAAEHDVRLETPFFEYFNHKDSRRASRTG